MAISLGRFKQEGQRRATSKKLAKEYAKQQKKESKRKGLSSFLGGVGGKLLGAGIGGALGIASGGLLMPLIMGASSFGAKKLAHEATKGMGAKTGKLRGDKYGYGGEEAQTLAEGLRGQISAGDPTKDGLAGLGKDIALSYVGAGASGKLGGVSKALKGGGKEQLFMGGVDDVVGTGPDAARGLKGFTTGIGGALGLGSTFGGAPEDDVIASGEDIISPAVSKDFSDVPMDWDEEAVADVGQAYQPSLAEDVLTSRGENRANVLDILQAQDIGQSYEVDDFDQGGQVPSQQQLLALLALAEMQNKKTYDDTPLEEVEQSPLTIVEYFGGQNKTLGGSSTKSLSQLLGR